MNNNTFVDPCDLLITLSQILSKGSGSISVSVSDSYYSIDYIITIVLKYYKTTEEFAFQDTNKRDAVKIRQIIMFYSKKLTKLSLSEIGNRVSGKDHSTVLHAIKTVNNLRDTDKKFKKELEEFELAYKIFD